MIIEYLADDLLVKSGCFYFEAAGFYETSFITSVAIQDQTQLTWPYDLTTSIALTDERVQVRFINDIMSVASRVEPLNYTRALEHNISLSDALSAKEIVLSVPCSIALSDACVGGIVDPDEPIYGEFGKVAPPATVWTKECVGGG